MCTCTQLLSHVHFFGLPGTVACQAPLSMGSSKQECWSVLPFPSPGDLANPGSNLHLLHWQTGSLPPSHQGAPYSTAVLRVFTFLCNCRHGPSPELFHFAKQELCAHETVPHFLLPSPLAANILLSVSRDLTTLRYLI